MDDMWSYSNHEPRKIFITLHDRDNPREQIVVDIMGLIMIKEDPETQSCTLHLEGVGPVAVRESAHEVMRIILEVQQPKQP